MQPGSEFFPLKLGARLSLDPPHLNEQDRELRDSQGKMHMLVNIKSFSSHQFCCSANTTNMDLSPYCAVCEVGTVSNPPNTKDPSGFDR